jgi:hypothetical protein
MSAPLIESLRLWSDVQSLLSRASELEVAFKAPLARKMLLAAYGLFRWHKQRCSGVRVLGLAGLGWLGLGAAAGAGGLGPGGACSEIVDEPDGLDGAELGYEGSDGEGAVLDQDTETEMPGEGDQDDLQDPDSDAEGGADLHAHQIGHLGLVMGFGF